jgi:hypothetical protein
METSDSFCAAAVSPPPRYTKGSSAEQWRVVRIIQLFSHRRQGSSVPPDLRHAVVQIEPVGGRRKSPKEVRDSRRDANLDLRLDKHSIKIRRFRGRDGKEEGAATYDGAYLARAGLGRGIVED